MSTQSKPVVTKGDLILVTGVNGYIGSHVADQALTAGLKVRGVVRNLETTQWVQQVFDEKYGKGNFELVQVEDLTKEGALDEAVKGVAGIAHVSTVTGITSEPEPYVSNVTALTLNTLKSAQKEPGVKRVVVTSSSMAAFNPKANEEYTITSETWNEDALRDAYIKPYGPANGWNVYGASKANAEREGWRWVEKNKPHFTYNAVLPNTNWGPAVSPKDQGFASTNRIVVGMFEGDEDMLKNEAPQAYVDARDTARLHIIALMNPSVNGERIFSFAEKYTMNRVLGILRKLHPGKTFLEDLPNPAQDMSIVPNKRAEELLQESGRPGWIPMEQAIIDLYASMA